jgi:chromosome segregation ATPase
MPVYVPRGNKKQRERDVEEIKPLATEIQLLKLKLLKLQMEFIDIRKVQNENNKQPISTLPRNTIDVAGRAAAAVEKMTKLQQELMACKEKDENLSEDIKKDLAYYTGLYQVPPLEKHVDDMKSKIYKKYNKSENLYTKAHLCTMRQILERHG